MDLNEYSFKSISERAQKANFVYDVLSNPAQMQGKLAE